MPRLQLEPFMMKIAVIADTHIPDCRESAEEAALEWAVGVCRNSGADVVICAGDITASGAPGEWERAQRVLAKLHGPIVCTPGNSDLRTPQFAGAIRAALAQSAVARAGAATVLGLDTAEGSIPPEEKRRFEAVLERETSGGLGRRRIVAATHWPPGELPPADRAWLAALLGRVPTELLVAGHKHVDKTLDFSGIPVALVRGLDPEKAIGAPPALAVFTRNAEGDWTGSEETWPECEPVDARNPLPAGQDFLSFLGISTMGQTLENIADAAAARAPALELRAGPGMKVSQGALQRLLEDWRRAGGRWLSAHLPDLRWDGAAGRISGEAALKSAAAWALRLGANQVTVHVPRARREEMLPGTAGRGKMLRCFAEGLADCAAAGLGIGVENLHRTAQDPPGMAGPFGCVPTECLGWVRDLRGLLPGARVGPLLDIGHARNNPPLSHVWTLGRWLAEVGPGAVGYHVHQVTAKGNHQPFSGAFGPLISLAGMFWGWRTGRLARAPMFLEIRDGAPIESLQVLRKTVRSDG